MDEQRKHTAVPIPQREGRQERQGMRRQEKGGVVRGASSDVAAFADVSAFAEVEVDFGIAPTSQAHAQPIEQRIVDPIRAMFYRMRSLATGNPFARNDAVLFYVQAKLMESFEDDYSGYVHMNMIFPCYQHMGYEQLRTYFTWRTKARRGKISKTTMSYICLYIYELLNGVGVRDPLDGLERLMAIWEGYRTVEPKLDEYLPQWIWDYHVYYELPWSFSAFAQERGIRHHYGAAFLFEAGPQEALSLWNNLSTYDILHSRFYMSDHETLVRDGFYAVLGGLRALCESRGTGIEALFVHSVSQGTAWLPFKRALFHAAGRQRARRVVMPGQAIYYCKDNKWTVDTSIHHKGRKELIGYVLKKTEACLRAAVKYRYIIKADPGTIVQSTYMLRRVLGLGVKELDAAIEGAVAAYYEGLQRVVVAVDQDRLARIREEARDTQDKLIVPEDGGNGHRGQTHADVAVMGQAEVFVLDTQEPLPISNAWTSLKEALDEIEMEALRLATEGCPAAAFKTFADAQGLMLEILAERINEKAADVVGDTILECDGTLLLYDAYLEDIKGMVEHT